MLLRVRNLRFKGPVMRLTGSQSLCSKASSLQGAASGRKSRLALGSQLWACNVSVCNVYTWCMQCECLAMTSASQEGIHLARAVPSGICSSGHGTLDCHETIQPYGPFFNHYVRIHQILRDQRCPQCRCGHYEVVLSNTLRRRATAASLILGTVVKSVGFQEIKM